MYGRDIRLMLTHTHCTCIEVPALNWGQTLILALPKATGSGEDLLCPVHPLPGERCVDLLSCNRFRESAYANSITVCRTRKSDLSLEMCFHNVSGVMNGTRLHFLYPDLSCHPNGIQPESTRTYIKSVQLVVINPAGIYRCIVVLKVYLWLSNLIIMIGLVIHSTCIQTHNIIMSKVQFQRMFQPQVSLHKVLKPQQSP